MVVVGWARRMKMIVGQGKKDEDDRRRRGGEGGRYQGEGRDDYVCYNIDDGKKDDTRMGAERQL